MAVESLTVLMGLVNEAVIRVVMRGEGDGDGYNSSSHFGRPQKLCGLLCISANNAPESCTRLLRNTLLDLKGLKCSNLKAELTQGLTNHTLQHTHTHKKRCKHKVSIKTGHFSRRGS